MESRIGGGFGCCGCTGASASYIDHVIEEDKGTGRSSWKRKKKLSSVSFQKHEQTYKIVQGTALTGWWFTKTCIGI